LCGGIGAQPAEAASNVQELRASARGRLRPARFREPEFAENDPLRRLGGTPQACAAEEGKAEVLRWGRLFRVRCLSGTKPAEESIEDAGLRGAEASARRLEEPEF